MSAQRAARKTAGSAATAAVRVRGLPHELSAVVPQLTTSAEWAPVSLETPYVALSAPLLALIVPLGTNAAHVRLRLPPSTPPGTYTGTVEVGGQTRPLHIDVERHASVAVHPDSLTIRARAGTQESAEVIVVNQGNVAVEIGRGYALGFVDVQAVDSALAAAVRSELRAGERRVDLFFDELARGSGGAARLDVQAGSGLLEPGESRTVRGRFSLPKDLRAGHTYSSPWRIEDAAFSIRVEVISASTAREVAT